MMTTCLGLSWRNSFRVSSPFCCPIRISMTMRSGIDFLRHADAFIAGLGAENIELLLLQQAAEGIMNVLFIVDDQDGLPGFAGGGGRLRRTTSSNGRCRDRFAGGCGHGIIYWGRPTAVMNGLQFFDQFLVKTEIDLLLGRRSRPRLDSDEPRSADRRHSGPTAALHSSRTRSARPQPWLGSMITGRCDSFFTIATEARSSVLRV